MKKFAVIVVIGLLVGAGWYLIHDRRAESDAESEAETQVAVRVAEITRATLHAYVTAYGVVEPEPAGEAAAASALVSPSVPGIVVAVNVAEGQTVARDEVLFQQDSRAADIAVDFAAATVEREKQLLAIEGTSEKALEAAEQQLEVARVQQSLLRIRSPLDGTVTRVNVTQGAAVDSASVLAEVVDLERLIVSAAVPGPELGAVARGQPVQIIVDGSPDALTGTVDFIGPKLDAQTGTAPVRARLASGSRLRPGQRVTLRIVSDEHRDRLAVPVESVVKDETGATVIAVVDGDMAVQTPVTTGLKDGALVEVAGDGLRAGMTVVTEGAYGLPATTRIRIVGN
jgi:membrane fusion protein (multidrug efflux system)